MVAYFNIWLVPLLAVSIDCFCNVKALRCIESEFFLTEVKLLPFLDGRTTV